MLTANTIKLIKSLQQKKFRNQEGRFVAEGQRLVSDLLQSTLSIDQVYYTTEWENNSQIVDNRFHPISAKDMARISGLKTPTSVLAVAKIPENSLEINQIKNSLTLALDNIQDPGNLGTIIRLADWFGIRTIVCSAETADAFSPKVVQATMGAIARVKVIYVDLIPFLNDASAQKIPVFGTFLNGDNIYSAQLPKNGIVVLGNEGNGISDEVSKRITQRITIPSFTEFGPTSESLNVAMATAIVCSEFRRRTM